ncbi:hypothetical protein CN505_04920 [Bacillus cereus]|nr:hypothetical protein CON53_27150 [Bacillus cereus]PES82475.1 hypothetical protein CN509_06410 [Bacillus cereus]PET08555.1 hypothetical protein CN505_04920 [Bacillus cereus]PFH80791.1 hypothetical protein COI81_29815 [Bacillus cereus]PGS20838.1 hypothetical protein COC55_26850 [Bacillus cereus]
MFKKGILSFLLFILVISSFNGIASAETSVQENITKKFYAYDEPSFTSPKSNWGNQFNPQVVTVKEKRSNGWWKIATSQGDKWISLNGEVKGMSKAFYVYNEPSFSSAKANLGVQLNPQSVNVRDGNTDGWLKIATWEGDKWINPNMEEIQVKEKFYVYNEPSLIAQKGNNGNQYNPQFVVVKEQRSDGWWRISTAEGDKWAAPNGIKMPVYTKFTTFDEPYLEAKKSGTFDPQNLIAYDGKKTEQGDFYLVGTYLGQKWMSLNGEKEFNEKREPMRQELGYNETTFDFNTLDVQKSETASLRAAEAKNPSGKTLKIPTKEEREEFLKNNNTNARSFSQSARSIPADWVHKGDVIYTPNSYGGLAGHSAIVVKDFTETQNFPGELKGAYIIAQAPGIGENPAIQINSLEQWEFQHKDNPKYHRFYYMRHVDSRTSIKAADYAYNHFYQNRYNYKYNIFASSANTDDKYTYCSKLVYLSFRDGAGVDLFSNKNKYIVHPADFLISKQLIMYFRGDGGSWG